MEGDLMILQIPNLLILTSTTILTHATLPITMRFNLTLSVRELIKIPINRYPMPIKIKAKTKPSPKNARKSTRLT